MRATEKHEFVKGNLERLKRCRESARCEALSLLSVRWGCSGPPTVQNVLFGSSCGTGNAGGRCVVRQFRGGCLQPLFSVNVFMYAQVRVGHNWTRALSPEADFAGLKCVVILYVVVCGVSAVCACCLWATFHPLVGILSTSSQALL